MSITCGVDMYWLKIEKYELWFIDLPIGLWKCLWFAIMLE